MLKENHLVVPHRISWTGVLAGALAGMVTYAALIGLGIAIGLIVPLNAEVELSALAGRSAVWLGLSMALGAFLGGLTSARAAGHLTPAQGRFNGLMVGMLLLAFMSLFTLNVALRSMNSLLSMFGNVVSSTLSTASSALSTDNPSVLESLGLSNEYQTIVDTFNQDELSRLIAEASPELNQEQVQAAASVVVQEMRTAGQRLGENLGEVSTLDEVFARQVDALQEALSGDAFVARLENQGLSGPQAREVATVLGERVREAREQIQQTLTALQDRTAQLAETAAAALARAAWIWLLVAGICLLFATLGGGLGNDEIPIRQRNVTTFTTDPARPNKV